MAVISAGRLAVILGILVALGPLAIDTYLPAIPAIADFYGVAVPLVETSLSAYMIGTGFGQLIGGPLSDQLGRKPVAWTGLAMFATASILITFLCKCGGGFPTPARSTVFNFFGLWLRFFQDVVFTRIHLANPWAHNL